MSSERSDTPIGDSLVTPASMAAVDRAEAYASAFCRAQRIGPRLERVLQLIIEEMVTNTVTHGQPPQESNIELGLRRDGGHILLYYRDRGIAFDPVTDRQLPDFSQTMRSRPLGGVGWSLIYHYCAEVRYRRIDDSNDLRLSIPAQARPVF